MLPAVLEDLAATLLAYKIEACIVAKREAFGLQYLVDIFCPQPSINQVLP
jgi:hypothetical protein